MDITFRAVEILRKSKYIFAEDTRNSRKLLEFYKINTKLIACHEHNEIADSVTKLIDKSVIFSLITDAGTPTISDPGYRIVNWCAENDVSVFPIPGACSFVAGLSASGLPTDAFSFFGFLPNKKQARMNFLCSIKDQKHTMIFFESSARILATLSDMIEIFGDRACCVCREITKVFEEFIRGSLQDAAARLSSNSHKGEFVIIVSGYVQDAAVSDELICSELTAMLQELSVRDSVKHVSEKYSLAKNVVYKKALEIANKRR